PPKGLSSSWAGRMLSGASSDSRSCMVQPPWSQRSSPQLPCRRRTGAGEAISRARRRAFGTRADLSAARRAPYRSSSVRPGRYGEPMRRIAVNGEAHEGPVGNRARGVLDLGGDDQSCLNGSPRAREHARRLPAVGLSPSALALVVVLSAQLMVVLDFSIVNVALPSIQRELAFSATGLEWVVTAYAITSGG